MTTMALKSRECLMEDIKCLETKLSHLQERFDVIVTWVRSQHYDFTGLPDYVVIAVRGDEPSSEGRNEYGEIEHVKVEYDYIDDSTKDSTDLNDIGDILADSQCKNYVVKVDEKTSFSSEQNLSATKVHEQSSSFPLPMERETNLKWENEDSDNSGDSNQTDGDNEATLYRPIRHFDGNSTGVKNERVKKTLNLQINKKKGLILDAVEYEELVDSLPLDRLSCCVCSKTFPTSTQLRRHEFETHLPKEERAKLRNKIPKHLQINKKKKLILDAVEYKERVDSLPMDRLSCCVCSKTFTTPTQLRRHELETHLPKEERAKLRNKIPKHLRINKKKKLILDAVEYKERVDSLPMDRLSCCVCSKTFTTPTQLRRHEFEVHLPKEERAKLRNKDVELHFTKKPTTVEPTMCDICNMPFKHIESHKMNHLPPEVITSVEGSWRPHYSCLKCDSLFTEKKKYLDHVKRDCKAEEIVENSNYAQKLGTEKNFLCSQCGQAFNRKYTLKIHIAAVHAKRKDFKCKYCSKSFTVEFVKKNHEKKHLGMTSVTCDLCGFTFTCKKILKKHIEGVHENRRPFKCQLCDKSFKTDHARKYHVNTHGDPNGRKRGLNRDVDPVHAAAKRRNCITWKNNRVQPVESLTSELNEYSTVSKESEGNH